MHKQMTQMGDGEGVNGGDWTDKVSGQDTR